MTKKIIISQKLAKDLRFFAQNYSITFSFMKNEIVFAKIAGNSDHNIDPKYVPTWASVISNSKI
jgi:hypothetical protein